MRRAVAEACKHKMIMEDTSKTNLKDLSNESITGNM